MEQYMYLSFCLIFFFLLLLLSTLLPSSMRLLTTPQPCALRHPWEMQVDEYSATLTFRKRDSSLNTVQMASYHQETFPVFVRCSINSGRRAKGVLFTSQMKTVCELQSRYLCGQELINSLKSSDWGKN